MKSSRSITIKDSVVVGNLTYEGAEDIDICEFKSCTEEAKQGIELLRQLKSVIREDAADYQRIELTRDKKNTGDLIAIKMVPDEFIIEELKDIKKGISKIDEKLEGMIVSLKPGITGELVISKGIAIGGSGVQIVATIPLIDIQYPELSGDLENIKERATELSKLPERLVKRIRYHLS